MDNSSVRVVLAELGLCNRQAFAVLHQRLDVPSVAFERLPDVVVGAGVCGGPCRTWTNGSPSTCEKAWPLAPVFCNSSVPTVRPFRKIPQSARRFVEQP